MSRSTAHYDYSPPPENYFMEGPEIYTGDYSDNDCVQENINSIRGSPPNMMGETYSRNSTVVPVHVVPYNKKMPQFAPKQQPEQFIQQSYYNGNFIPPQRSYYSKPYELSRNYYPISTTSQHDTHFGTKAYCSACHNVEQFSPVNYGKHVPEVNCSRIHPRPVTVKKFPVTFPTPKYYKKSPANAIFKRPSALCLPGATQPDPAVVRRPRKVPIFTGVYEGMPETEDMRLEPLMDVYKPVTGFELPHRVDSQGDVNIKQSNFDELFEQMEQGVIAQKTENKEELIKFAKLLKPRVPPSIRLKQDKLKCKPKKPAINLNSNDASNNANKTNKPQYIKKDVTEPTATSLEKLLNQLKKCELSMGKDEPGRNVALDKDKPEVDRKEVEKNKDGETKMIEGETIHLNLDSFNYQDINENMRSKCDVSEGSNSMEHLPQQKINSPSNSSSKPKTLSKPALDDHCALELHKSKSYIVNLIDRALSKELGTIPSNRGYAEFDDMNPKRAIDLMNRHVLRSDKELNGSLTESHLSNYTIAETMDMEEDKLSSKLKLCQCNSEEPIYIKQLKQLRWGHLKHIQREVKKLEELERFLDSCSITTIPEA